MRYHIISSESEKNLLHTTKLIKKIPLDQLPQKEELKAGMMLMLTLPEGVQFTALVSEIDEETVTLDLNHPLAGQTLNFKITVVDIVS